MSNKSNNAIDTVLNDYLVKKIDPIIGVKTIQILILREILDYSIFRTEESKELNTVVTPKSILKDESVTRVAFLASKQKAVESRELERMLRTACESNDISVEDKFNIKNNVLHSIKKCYLKDCLCLRCPRCILHGGTVAGNKDSKYKDENNANIKHRIEYSTAFSLLEWEEIEESITFNAISDQTITTGQALGNRYTVKPSTVFPSIVTLKSVTKEELILTIKTILSAKSYGAETRIGGDVRNHIIGIVAGWEELITPLEFTLELYDNQDKLKGNDINNIRNDIDEILSKYLDYSANPNQILINGKKISSSSQDKNNIESNNNAENLIQQIIDEARNTDLNKEFLNKIYKDVDDFRNIQK